jgi:ABC-type cobalt transport system, ATPase component
MKVRKFTKMNIINKLLFQVSILLFFVNRIQSLAPAADQIKFFPFTLKCNGITQSYPLTLLTKLFSSVPKRQYALQDINLSFGNARQPKDDDVGIQKNFCLLVGRSASGKSSLLRIISGQERPASGEVLLNGISLYPSVLTDEDLSRSLPKTVIVDSKPDCFDDQFTVLQRIENSAAADKGLDSQVRNSLALSFAKILNLSENQLSGYSLSLSPSGQYLFGLACASMASCHLLTIEEGAESSRVVNVFPPILLLDELLDRETSIVAGNVGKGLTNLAKHGAIIICATHRHQYLVDYADRMITLSGGKLIKDEIF